MEKTFIGVLASHDSVEKNVQLAKIFRSVLKRGKRRKTLKRFRFVFTGGTYDRLFGDAKVDAAKHDPKRYKLKKKIKKFLHKKCGVVRLPGTSRGGVTILSSLVTRRQVSILWPFFSPITTHLLFPENLALMRLSDQCRVKKLMNSGSVNEWLEGEADRDSNLNRRTLGSLDFTFPGTIVAASASPAKGKRGLQKYAPKKAIDVDFIRAKKEGTLDEKLGTTVAALISHDAMKGRMLDFAVDYERELVKFRKIIATGTTGGLIGNAAPDLKRKKKIHRYHSGPKGGDVEIATQVLFGACHVVIFFVDPLHPHPHTEDIRVVFAACMIENRVRMLSNEVQARDWMDRVIREV
ncbi:MAG: methylglyoxal synthase [bacterium]|nr:methylglyoxal synthase [bacterium]